MRHLIELSNRTVGNITEKRFALYLQNTCDKKLIHMYNKIEHTVESILRQVFREFTHYIYCFVSAPYGMGRS